MIGSVDVDYQLYFVCMFIGQYYNSLYITIKTNIRANSFWEFILFFICLQIVCYCVSYNVSTKRENRLPFSIVNTNMKKRK